MLQIAPLLKPTFIISLTLLVMNAFAQNPLDIFKSNIDSSYIQSFPNALTVKGFIKSKYLNLNVEDHDKGYRLNYKPNANNSIGFGLSYKWIGFGIDFKIINPNDAQTYGETDYLDFRTNFYLRKGVFDLFFQKYKGFYLENTAAMVDTWGDENEYLLRPDIEVVSTGVNYTHLFNPEKFSYIASFSQTEVQKKSAGSIILGASVNFHRVSADSSFIPKDLIYEEAFAGTKVNSIKGLTTSARFGYAHTLVVKQRLFLSLSVDAGLSYVFSIYREENKDKQTPAFNVSPNVAFRFATGYNYNKWFAGITASGFYQKNGSTGLENVIRIEYGFINFVVARRIMLNKEIWLPKLNFN